MRKVGLLKHSYRVLVAGAIALVLFPVSGCQSVEAQRKLEKVVRGLYDASHLNLPTSQFELEIKYYEHVVVFNNSSTESLRELQKTLNPLLSTEVLVDRSKRKVVGTIKVTSGTDFLNVQIESSDSADKRNFALKYFSPDGYDSYYSFFDDNNLTFLNFMVRHSSRTSRSRD